MNTASSLHTSTTIEKDTGLRNQLVQGTVKKIDVIFPLFNNMFQNNAVIVPLFYLAALYWGFQAMFLAMWPMSSYWDTKYMNHAQSKLYEGLKVGLLMFPTPYNSKAIFIKEIVFFVANIFSLLIIISQMLYYNVHRSFMRYLLNPIQSYDAVTLIGILPSAFVVGENFLKITQGETDFYIIISFVLAIVNVIYELIYHYLILRLTAKSVSLQNLPFLSFDPFITYAIINTVAVTLICTYLILYFAKWTILIAMVAHAVIFVYLASNVLYMHYIIHTSNSLFFGMLLNSAALDVMMFVAYFKTGMNHFVPVIFCAGFYIFLFTLSLIMFHFMRRNVIKKLSVSNLEDKISYYESLGILKNDKKILTYLSIGFANTCPLFYDLSLMEYLFQNSTSEYVLTNMLQIINFFPGETRFLNRLTGLLITNRRLNFDQRFLIYQIYKIKTLRQFSSSNDSNMKLNDLKTMSRQVESLTRSALETTNLKPGFYEELAVKAKRANAIWVEALCDYPNNPKFCDEYCRYLIESEANFPEALKIKHRGNLIEMGKNYSFDYSFRSMVKLIPSYIKKEIIDLRGNIRQKDNRQKNGETLTQSSNGSGSGGSNQISFSSDIDDDIQESIGKQTFTQCKTRLALHRALNNKLPGSIKCIIPLTIVILLIVTAVFIFMFVFTKVELFEHTDSMAMLDSISKTRYYLAINDMEILLRFIQDRGNYAKYKPTVDKLDNECKSTYKPVLNMTDDFLVQSLPNLHAAMDVYSDLINKLAQLANNRDDVYEVAGNLISDMHTIYTCFERTYVGRVNDTISTMISIFFAHQAYIVTRYQENISDLYNETQFCELISNLRSFYVVIPTVFMDLSKYQVDKGENLKTKFQLILYIVPPLVAVVAFIPFLFVHFFTQRSLKEITQLIVSFDPKTRADAKELISVNVENDDAKLAETNVTSERGGCLLFLICLIALLFVGIATAMTLLSVKSNNHIIDLNLWDQYATLRLSLCAELINTLTFGMSLFENPNATALSNVSMAYYMCLERLKSLVESNQDLILGTSISKPCSGFDEVLDQENLYDEDINHTSMDSHSVYANASINTQLKILTDYVKTTLDEFVGSRSLSPAPVANIFHIFARHISPKMLRVTERLSQLAKVQYDDLMLIIGLLLIPAFVLIALYAIVISTYYNMRRDSYRAALFILKRINPHALINNKLFIKYFLNNNHEVHEVSKTVSGNIIQNAPDAILCTNLHGVVETVNPSTTSLLGYTPEQLLGQPVTTFFIQVDEEKVMQQLDMMRNGQASPIFEENVTAITDASQFMPCHITMLAIKPQNSSSINSFVIILRDQTQLVSQQKQAEEAKAQSEKLLYQILPRDIVLQINRGENDISFMVQSATICFIDIVKFSEYSVNLTPQEIMGNLSLYFGTVDSILEKFNLLTKIKLIGDIYMAAAGLFNPEVQAEKHAEQMLLFGTEVIAELDDINMKLNASLSVRIGVNTGGPIIAGVLGKDKPVFDIIGDPINVAARLQSTDEANYVQISQSCYDLVSHLSFDIKQRGEVFLKGKGKQMTYLVSPLLVGAELIDHTN
ncbi:Adenylate and Guanylate cyclase catalytic domain containing protein [Trichomonas vaginalis G3]|uniref:Adenylate and Guanylate cyclase catalytic domain containing protein n=1 Tax=Trichomonas vaginalis (strain ATCC PRA-98 / G3) TaxID=412133 RepID=A2D795_TRIV3|nr:guanylate cyclase protein [Trichomonas vaginalis G3]EAY23612.1 Adenylate and Guanylate cyclase catalytic domain containing protein [Trichomonas vaginalis G3]KAI5490105.1 guanylate cyclase protein [Trichomonas vaginalis G3]|eukprot:XP_001276860.1 Adenylate and Guanylate cyclase catalytic domain containing protein [Trichomonas vaginalis G3]